MPPGFMPQSQLRPPRVPDDFEWCEMPLYIVACGLCGYGSICLAFAARSPFEDSKAITDT